MDLSVKLMRFLAPEKLVHVVIAEPDKQKGGNFNHAAIAMIDGFETSLTTICCDLQANREEQTTLPSKAPRIAAMLALLEVVLRNRGVDRKNPHRVTNSNFMTLM